MTSTIVHSEPAPPDPAHVVLTFLESVGRRAEAELYLKLFRQVPKESFAVIVTESAVVRHARASFLDGLRFLHDLGLFAPVVVGVFSPAASERVARSLANAAQELDPVLHDAGEPELDQVLASELRADRLPIVHLTALADRNTAERFQWAGNLVAALRSQKLVMLRRRGGLGPHDGSGIELGPGHVLATHRGGIGVVNLTTDLDLLRASKALGSEDRELLGNLAAVVRRNGVTAAASVTSPLAMLQELFTQKGAGTLIKRGTSILRHRAYADLDRDRLLSLLEGTFGARLVPAFFDRPILDVYVEENYRGAAILEPSPLASYLTKFAVEPVAQGEGIGRDLWEAIVRDHAALFWRARADNPVSSWYATLADGMMRQGPWKVFWRGVAPSAVPALIEDADRRVADFVRES